MAKMVYVDPKLIAGENLRYAVFVKDLDERWVLQSAAPETGNVDEYENVAEAFDEYLDNCEFDELTEE